jgi:Cytochrome c7 and related cytochrome c
MNRRWIALLAACGLAACAGVLGLRRGVPAVFPHRAHVLAGIGCASCHLGIANAGAVTPGAAVTGGAAGRGPLHLPDDASCLGCHQKPHDPRPCSGCHGDPINRLGAAEAKAHLRFSHARHTTANEGDCMHCHDAVAAGDQRLRPPMATCFRCHDHEADRDGRRCAACHLDLSEEGTLPESHLAHDGDFLREHGVRAASSAEVCASCHRERFCAGCHGATTAMLPSRAQFDDPFAASAHRAGFAARHALEARANPGACSTCHSPERCQACHVRNNVADDLGARQTSPHPPGWVGLTENRHGSEARRDPASCASCHGGAGEALCVGCHRVGGVGGNPHPAGFSSRQPRSALPCRLCHPSGT